MNRMGNKVNQLQEQAVLIGSMFVVDCVYWSLAMVLITQSRMNCIDVAGSDAVTSEFSRYRPNVLAYPEPDSGLSRLRLCTDESREQGC